MASITARLLAAQKTVIDRPDDATGFGSRNNNTIATSARIDVNSMNDVRFISPILKGGRSKRSPQSTVRDHSAGRRQRHLSQTVRSVNQSGCSRGFRRIPDACGFREGEAPAEPCVSTIQRLGRSLALPFSQSPANTPFSQQCPDGKSWGCCHENV